MSGKILKVSTTDLYGKADERKVVVFAAFEHTKYMNNYVIFAIEGEYDKNKLLYGSVHLKENSLVVFAVKNDIKQYIDDFINEYENNKVNNYKILDINKMEKIELVSYNEMDYDKLQLLDDMAIFKEIKKEEIVVKEKKPIFLYVLLVLLVLFAVGLTLLYFKPEWFSVRYRNLMCTNNLYDNNVKLSYDINKNIEFSENGKVLSIDTTRTYTFKDSDSYYDFKDNNSHLVYFNNGEGYKYIDEEFQFKLIYQESTVIDDYDEMINYLKTEGYSCEVREYEK